MSATARDEVTASGTRALDQLRGGVQDAVTSLGTGFLRHPGNTAFRADFDAHATHNALLRLAYRMLFLFVAEDRDALHGPDASERARRQYADSYSSARLRAHARSRRATARDDLYPALRTVLDALGREGGMPELGLPGLGGLFEDTEADAPLRGLSLSDDALLTAVRHLSQVRKTGSLRPHDIDFRHLDAGELGSTYESLLELVPRHSPAEGTFALVELAGNTRKTTGSYYTPPALVDCLLESALDPVIDDAVKRGEAAASPATPDASGAIVSELLSLTVCDPACGSGHFLVAAARRIARRVAAVREGNPEPTPAAVGAALHEVVSRCVYGVDLNPLAVELAKASLWLEAPEPGRPLGFLDAHVKCGNALIGGTPALIAAGVPDEAFRPVEGDDKAFAKALERQNRAERVAGLRDPAGLDTDTDTDTETDPDSGGAEARDRSWAESARYLRAVHIADAWCAAFLWRKTAGAPPAVTEAVFRSLQDPADDTVPQSTHREIVRLRERFRFFHWHLEFPDVFTASDAGAEKCGLAGWDGGFACVLGNPPWERIKLQELEFFAQHDQAIATAGNAAARKALIAALRSDPHRRALSDEFEDAKREAEGGSHFLRHSARYPLTGRGDINTYAVFSETSRMLTGPRGRMGVIVPTGIATDATTQFFFKDLVRTGAMSALYDFENRGGLFPAVDSRMKFSVLSLTGRALREKAARFAFFLHDPAELADAERAFTLTPEEITLLSPTTGTCPVFRSRTDAEISLGVYRRVPVLLDGGAATGNPWGVSLMTMFHMSNDSHLFRTRQDLEADGWTLAGNVFTGRSARMIPLYEGRMGHQYTHRFADSAGSRESTGAQLRDAGFVVQPHYWVPAEEAGLRQERRRFRCRTAMLGHRRVARNNDERTGIATLIPWGAASYGWIISSGPDARGLTLLAAALNSYPYDYLLRNSFTQPSIPQSTSEQIPVPPPATLAGHAPAITARVHELTYTSYDMGPFARDLGDTGPPFRWDERRRAVIRAELDALFFHLYGIGRDDVDHIMETFPIVKRKDLAAYGSYRTRESILAAYDRMAAGGIRAGTPLVDGENYTSTLVPPPGHGPRHPA